MMQIYPEVLIRSILGPGRGNTRPFAYAVYITAERLFVQHMTIDELLFTKDIYCAVAKRLGGHPDSITRQIERVAGRCREKLCKEGLSRRYLGRSGGGSCSPHMLIICFAVYAYLGTPFYEALSLYPELFAGRPPRGAHVAAAPRLCASGPKGESPAP